VRFFGDGFVYTAAVLQQLALFGVPWAT